MPVGVQMKVRSMLLSGKIEKNMRKRKSERDQMKNALHSTAIAMLMAFMDLSCLCMQTFKHKSYYQFALCRQMSSALLSLAEQELLLKEISTSFYF